MTKPFIRGIAERLILQQQTDSSLEQKYRKEIDSMFEQRLSPVLRTRHVIRAAMAMGIIAYFAWSMATESGQPVEKWALGVCAIIVAVISATYSIQIVWRGALDRRVKERMTASLQLLVIVVVAPVMLVAAAKAPTEARAIWLLGSGSIVVTVMAMLYLRVLIREASLKLEERNLELQLRMAELSDDK
jgi:hypothetical protein